MKIAQSPLSALRASSGDWLIVTLGLQEISSLLILRPEDLYSPVQSQRSLYKTVYPVLFLSFFQNY